MTLNTIRSNELCVTDTVHAIVNKQWRIKMLTGLTLTGMIFIKLTVVKNGFSPQVMPDVSLGMSMQRILGHENILGQSRT